MTTINDATPIYSSLAQDPDLEERVVMFADEMSDRIAVLENALTEQDFEKLQQAAHQLKGSAGSYGFEELTPYAAAVEFAVGEEEPEEQIIAVVSELVTACQRVRSGTSN